MFEELDSSHLRHPLIGNDQRDRLVAQRQLGQYGERFGTRFRADNAVLGAVLRSQVACDRLQDSQIVVDRQNRRLRHQVRLPVGPAATITSLINNRRQEFLSQWAPVGRLPAARDNPVAQIASYG